MHRLDANGGLTTYPSGTRFPASARAPRWEGDTLFFEDEAGATSLDLRGGSVR